MRPVLLAMIVAIGVAFHPAKAQRSLKDEADDLYRRAMNLDVGKMDSLQIVSNRIAELSREGEYDLGIVRSKLVGALYSINKFKLDSAIALLDDGQKVIDADPSLKNAIEEGMLSYYRGQAVFRKMQLDEADSLGKKALSIFEAHDDRFLMATVYELFGTVEKLRQNEFKGLSNYLKAYKLKTESGATPLQLRGVLEQIGASYRSMGQFEKALQHFRKLEQILSAIDPYHIALGNVYHDIGRTKAQMDENDSALYFFERANVNAGRNKNMALANVIKASIADVFTSSDRFEESNKLIVPMLRVGHSRFSPMVASLLITAATNYFQLKKYDSAMLLAKRGIAMSKNNNKQQALFAKIISDVYAVRNVNDSALHYLRMYAAAYDAFFALENQRKLSTLYAEVETLSKENEIELLEKQSELDKAEKNFLMWGGGLAGLALILIIVSLRLQYNNRRKAHEVERMGLQRALDLKEKDLHTQALKMIYLNNGITAIESNLKKLQTGTDGAQVKQLLSTIHVNKSLEKEWDNFNKYFSSVHGDFYDKINERYANFTISEKRLAGLIRMNLTNSEIASILNIESNSVKMAKYRLKKKVGLTDEEDIHAFLQKL